MDVEKLKSAAHGNDNGPLLLILDQFFGVAVFGQPAERYGILSPCHEIPCDIAGFQHAALKAGTFHRIDGGVVTGKEIHIHIHPFGDLCGEEPVAGYFKIRKFAFDRLDIVLDIFTETFAAELPVGIIICFAGTGRGGVEFFAVGGGGVRTVIHLGGPAFAVDPRSVKFVFACQFPQLWQQQFVNERSERRKVVFADIPVGIDHGPVRVVGGGFLIVQAGMVAVEGDIPFGGFLPHHLKNIACEVCTSPDFGRIAG